VHAGFARIGAAELPVDEHENTQEAAAFAYVRPHDIEIQRVADGDSAFRVKIAHIHTIGSLVRLELHREDNSEIVEAELSRERFRELALQAGESVWVKPRAVKVFLDKAS
jgi:sulfate transport system ATP-binding protein